jgi:hypothetical protein
MGYDLAVTAERHDASPFGTSVVPLEGPTRESMVSPDRGRPAPFPRVELKVSEGCPEAGSPMISGWEYDPLGLAAPHDNET